MWIVEGDSDRFKDRWSTLPRSKKNKYQRRTNFDDDTLLHLACKKNHACVDDLLEDAFGPGGNASHILNKQNADGFPPLHAAAKAGYVRPSIAI